MNTLLQGNKTAWSPRHSFRPHSLRALRSFGKCARRILEVRSPKSAVFGGGKSNFQLGCNVTLPPRAPGAAPRCPRFIALCRVSIAKRLAEKTNKLLQGLIRGGAPRAPSRHARRARSCIVVHFTCPLVAERFKSTFHVFANVLAKTFHFCAAVYVRLPLTYIRAKISRPEQGRTSSLIAHCALAQDINQAIFLKV